MMLLAAFESSEIAALERHLMCASILLVVAVGGAHLAVLVQFCIAAASAGGLGIEFTKLK